MIGAAEHADKSLDKNIQKLIGYVENIGSLVLQQLELVQSAIANQSEVLSVKAKLIDKEVNELNFVIEEEATNFITKHQVFMDDLRFIFSTLKMASYLENMGDLAKNTVKRLSRLTGGIPESVRDDLARMASISSEMLGNTISLIRGYDEQKALEICRADDEVDEVYVHNSNGLKKAMAASPDHIEENLNLVLATRNLERIADFSVDLTKLIYYIYSGKRLTKKMIKE